MKDTTLALEEKLMLKLFQMFRAFIPWLNETDDSHLIEQRSLAGDILRDYERKLYFNKLQVRIYLINYSLYANVMKVNWVNTKRAFFCFCFPRLSNINANLAYFQLERELWMRVFAKSKNKSIGALFDLKMPSFNWPNLRRTIHLKHFHSF